MRLGDSSRAMLSSSSAIISSMLPRRVKSGALVRVFFGASRGSPTCASVNQILCRAADPPLPCP